MQPLMALLVGLLYAAGLYLMLGRNMVKIVLGLSLLSHAANLLIFVSGGLVRGAPPILSEAGAAGPIADPLPQALILTAIVIGFGLFAFALLLYRRAVTLAGSEDIDALVVTDR